MSNKRITTTMLPASYADGQVLYGYDINKIITVLREGINFNKYAFETFLGGDSDVIVRDSFAFLPVGVDDPAVGDVAPSDGDVALVFEKEEDGSGNLVGYSSLKKYVYSDTAGAWEEQDGYTLEDLEARMLAITDALEEDVVAAQADADANAADISDLLDGTQAAKKAEQDADGNVITDTYETKADATTHKGRTTVLETFKNTTVPATYVPKTFTLAGIDFADNISASELKTAIGNATTLLAGFMSAEDKTHLDTLVALLADDDADSVVDTIAEILNIFSTYPEGADIVTALAGKVDKETGKGLSANDFTDVLKSKVDNIYTTSEITALANVGMIEAEDTVSSGTTLQQFIEQLLVGVYTTQYPTLIAPYATVATNQVTNIETGTVVDVGLTSNFNRGRILGSGLETEWNSAVEQNKRAGAATSYELGVDGEEVDNGLSTSYTVEDYEIVDGDNVFSVIVNHAVGAQPLDSDGENYDSPLPAGTVEDTVTLKGVRKLFYGYSNDAVDSEDIRALNFSTLNPQNGTSFTVNVPIGATNVVFAYPATLREVLSVSQVGVGDAKAQFVESEVNVESAKAGAAGEVAYRVYVFTPAEAYLTEETYEVVI